MMMTDVMCHLYTPESACRSLCNISIHLMKTIEHTQANILVYTSMHVTPQIP
jgi:hypothetical protein